MKIRLIKTVLTIWIIGAFAITVTESHACCHPYPPTADLVAVPTTVPVDVNTVLDGSGSTKAFGWIEKWEWDFTNDSVYDYNETTISCPDGNCDGKTSHAYSAADTYTVVLRVTDDCELTDTYDTCTVTVTEPALKILDSSGDIAAVFDDVGNLFLIGGTLTAGPAPSAGSNDELRVQDSSSNDVAIIDADTGNMYIYGTLYENQGTLSPGAGNNGLIIRDSSENDVAYINDSGDLYLKGSLYEL